MIYFIKCFLKIKIYDVSTYFPIVNYTSLAWMIKFEVYTSFWVKTQIALQQLFYFCQGVLIIYSLASAQKLYKWEMLTQLVYNFWGRLLNPSF
uniref:Uncharacterized protein n=1 Tax=Meloidogyne enterolobii TaxID=390850 RepID=A0A6V7VHL0_MELEN|nr:unnamed protein product [Meloidogyne enterolobii]